MSVPRFRPVLRWVGESLSLELGGKVGGLGVVGEKRIGITHWPHFMPARLPGWV
ncbi:MAG: hypothetical protein ACYC23_16905 [Limisphaerales bacterium]